MGGSDDCGGFDDSDDNEGKAALQSLGNKGESPLHYHMSDCFELHLASFRDMN